MASELRALAERLDLVSPCPLGYLDSTEVGGECPFCRGSGQRLPTEAEVRAAIFEAAIAVNVWTNGGHVAVTIYRRGQQWNAFANEGEAASDDLVLLALLRALEAARG